MKVQDIFPTKYAGGEDLQGKAWTVTIDSVEFELMRPSPHSPEVEKPVLYTREGRKGFVMGRTLALQIAEALGEDDTDRWQGRKIVIYPEPMIVAGEARVAVRARAVAEEAVPV
jgi:hypothetical protein